MTEPSGSVHTPIQLKEVLELLAADRGGSYVDATANGGGHTAAILAANENNRVLAIDRDPDLIDRLGDTLAAPIAEGRLITAASSFRQITDLAGQHGFTDANGILFDLGLSSYHLDRSGRGFAFARAEPLDMRFGRDELSTSHAGDLIARAPASELTQIFRELGEERFASRIARTIVSMRDREPLETTTDLFAAIERSLPAKTRWRASRHAARVFQGLRIAVNDELTCITETLPDAWQCLASGGRMVVLSFHSLEDRLIKRFFRDRAKAGDGRLLTKKPMVATEEEVELNSRAASAKLRAIEKH